MSQLILHPSHGYSIASKNGASAKAVLVHTRTPENIEKFRWETGIAHILKKTPERIIIVIGSGMNENYNAPSNDSRARADHALDLLTDFSGNTIFFTTARFTYRLLCHANPELNPSSTDARQIAQYLVSRWVDPQKIISSEWSNCTIGDAVFARLLLGWAITPKSTQLQVVTSLFAEQRARIAFELLFPEWYIDYSTTRWWLSLEQEQIRSSVEHRVNAMYREQIRHYKLNQGDPLLHWLRFLREICTSTPWNSPDNFNQALNNITGWSHASASTYSS